MFCHGHFEGVLKMSLYRRIKEVSSGKNMTIAELERLSGISNGQIRRWDTSSPKVENLAKVAKTLHVSVDFLLGKEESSTMDEPVDLDKALSEEGMAMFDGKPLSEEYKKALLAMLRANKISGE